MEILLKKLPFWLEQFPLFCFFTSNNQTGKIPGYDFLAAVGSPSSVIRSRDELKNAGNIHKNEWFFGAVSYDYKNTLGDLGSSKTDHFEFPDFCFFIPSVLIAGKGGEVKILKGEESVMEDILNFRISDQSFLSGPLQARLGFNSYTEAVKKILQHIQRGDIYETNFCTEFYSTVFSGSPGHLFNVLNDISAAPMAAFCRFNDNWVVCSSPERYFAIRGQQVISQPIKGTARRSDLPDEDQRISSQLASDPKERSENIMIVDLVRNDLSRIAKKGSVVAEEICRLYSFRQVHQLISTVTAEIREELDASDVIRATFPMGSMTGAPKISAMKIAEQVEPARRGIYSGTLGYIDPAGDCDFNVVIRTIVLNFKKRYLSVMAGGAITSLSDPEKEYHECLLKANAMFKALGGDLVNNIDATEI